MVMSMKENECTVAGIWSGAIAFQSSLSTVHVVRVNIYVHRSETELPWTGHCRLMTYLADSASRNAEKEAGRHLLCKSKPPHTVQRE